MTNNNHHADYHKHHRMLLEDMESAEAAEDMLPVVERLHHWQAPTANAELTAALIEQLTAELPAPRKTRLQRNAEWWPLLLLYSQVRVVGRGIWVASALVMLLGTLVTLETYASSGMVLLAIIAPVVTAVSVALLYDTDVEQMLELENATAASVRLLLLARLVLVFGFNLLLGLLASLTLTLFQHELSLWPLVLSWLAPMTFLSALAFLLSVLMVNALASSAISLSLWGLHVWLRYVPYNNPLAYLPFLASLSHPANQPLLFGSAALLLLVALWLAGRNKYHTGALA